MISKTIALGPEDFFHARPATVISSTATHYESVLFLALGSELADVKNVFALMRLSHPQGRPFDLIADGPDEEAALAAVTAAIHEAFSSEPIRQ